MAVLLHTWSLVFPNEPYPRAGLVSEARRRTRREPSLTAPNVEETTSGRPGPGAKGPAARGPRPVPLRSTASSPLIVSGGGRGDAQEAAGMRYLAFMTMGLSRDL